MPSDLKSETSRINGAKSHGPKTPEGKETSSHNSLKHGFTSRKTFILQTESPDEYREFLAEHIAIHQPTTLPESELVDQMAIARWRIRRFVAAPPVVRFGIFAIRGERCRPCHGSAGDETRNGTSGTGYETDRRVI